MTDEYKGLFCQKCKHIGILNFGMGECPECGTILENITIDLPGLVKENKLELLSDTEDEGEGIFVQHNDENCELDSELLED